MDNLQKNLDVGVSVVIPTYNQDKLFKRALDSIRVQTHKKIEIIVVDDNIDNNYSNYVKNIINNSNEQDITYIKNDENLGSAKSRNRGVSHSKYEYITFLDDDDYYLPSKVKIQLDNLINTENLYSICNIILKHSNGLEDARKRKYIKNKEELLAKHLKYHITATSTFMYKKSFFQEVGGFPSTDLGDEFILMTNSILKSNKLSHCDSILVIADVSSNSGLSSGSNKIISENNLIKYKKKYFNKIQRKDIRYIKMRHHLVKSVAYFKINNYFKFIKHSFFSVLSSPFGIFNIVRGNHR